MSAIATGKNLVNISVLKVILGVVIMSISSQIAVPWYPVPVALAPTMALLIGITYSMKEASFTLISYLALGLMGMPVFANYNSGLLYALGPTCGYMVGYLAAVIVINLVKPYVTAKSTFWRYIILCLVGQVALYSLGIAWLVLWYLPLESAIYKGLIIFILPGIIKNILLAKILGFIDDYTQTSNSNLL